MQSLATHLVEAPQHFNPMHSQVGMREKVCTQAVSHPLVVSCVAYFPILGPAIVGGNACAPVCGQRVVSTCERHQQACCTCHSDDLHHGEHPGLLQDTRGCVKLFTDERRFCMSLQISCAGGRAACSCHIQILYRQLEASSYVRVAVAETLVMRHSTYTYVLSDICAAFVSRQV